VKKVAPPGLVGFLLHPLVSPDLSCLQSAQTVIEAAGLEVWRMQRGAAAGRRPSILRRTRLVLTVGGDGTLLSGAHLAAPWGIPLLGVNLGRLGFLTELEAGELSHGIGRFLGGDYRLEERTLLEVRVIREGAQVTRAVGLNEAAIQTGSASHLLRLRALVDGQVIGTFDADGVITATATGSTAYALAAGGPILTPGVEGLVLVPLNPFALTVRPIVFPPRQSLTIELPREGAQLTVDGGRPYRLQQGDKVEMAAHDRPVRFVRFGPSSRFYTSLREKIGWGLPLVPTVTRH
jgi:NAD+ kinase